MIALDRDMQRIRGLFEEIAREMGHEHLPPLGAMIETPSAALTVADIARYADFLCIGTNDLTQYTLAVGRDDASVSEYYIDDHPALFRLLEIALRDARGKSMTICGELGGREEAIPSLLRLRRLSIAPPIPATKDLIRSLSLDDFEQEATVALPPMPSWFLLQKADPSNEQMSLGQVDSRSPIAVKVGRAAAR
jgi:phosphotransferase system enzyme I (PtsI)